MADGQEHRPEDNDVAADQPHGVAPEARESARTGEPSHMEPIVGRSTPHVEFADVAGLAVGGSRRWISWAWAA